MKPKIKKYIKYIAMAIFVFALVANISITSTNPFLFSSKLVLAQVTTTTTTSTGWVDPSSTTANPANTNTGWTGNGMQEAKVTKEVKTYYKFDASAKLWVVVSVATQADRTEITHLEFKCCVDGGGPGCGYVKCKDI